MSLTPIRLIFVQNVQLCIMVPFAQDVIQKHILP